jgi:nucleoside-diphosphate-sugar epimerase
MTDDTVLVTGGTGFLGAHTARTLLEDGHDVVVTDVSTDRRRLEKLGVDDDVRFRRLDITDPTAVVRTVRETGASRVVHLGALTSLLARTDPRAAVDVNVTGTNNVFEAARTLDDQVQRVVWASSMAVYAPARHYGGGPVDEDDLLRPDSIYGATKEFCEHQADVYAEEFDLPVVGLRPTGVYGPFNNPDYLASEGVDSHEYRSPSGRLARLFARAAQGQPVSMTFQRGEMDWIYVADVARLFAAAAVAPEADLSQRVYNAASGDSASVERVADLLRELLPDAELDLDFEGESGYVDSVDGTAVREDLGVTLEHDLRSGVAAYVNAVRRDQGLDPVETGSTSG